MDSSLADVDVSRLSDREKMELQQFIKKESQKTKIQGSIHGLTDACFKKCVPAGGVKSATLDKYEEPCLKHCVDRLMDAQVLVWKQLEKMNATMG